MDISSGIFGTMFMISNSLLYPVVLVLLGLIAWSFISVGQFVSEYTARSRDSRRLKTNCRDAKSKIEKGDLNGAASALTGSGSNDLLQRFTKDISEILDVENFPVEAEKLLQDYELTISGELMPSRLVSRVGPMMGLMGTLIPMGPALIGLSSGNIQQLAENLVIAFATTVLGLLAGGVAYSILVIKKKWYTQDLSDMEYVVEVLK